MIIRQRFSALPVWYDAPRRRFTTRSVVPQFLSLAAGAVVAACLLFAPSCFAQAQRESASARPPVRDRERHLQVYVKSYQELRRENVVMQQRDYSCGAAALATLVRFHLGDDVTELGLLQVIVRMLTAEEMRERIENGLSMTDLRRLAVRLGYLSSTVRLTIDQLRESRVPLVVGIVVNDYDHFAVYRGMDDKYVYLADPARGNVRTPIAEFAAQWQRNAALVVTKQDETGEARSAFMVRPEESFLGTTNTLFLRERLSTDVGPPQ